MYDGIQAYGGNALKDKNDNKSLNELKIYICISFQMEK